MFERNDGQSLTMRQAGQQPYQQESGSSRSSSGSDGRSGRRGQPHQIRSARQSSSTVVPAFTIRSASQSRVQPPKRVNVFAERPSPSLAFRRIYQRGDLPVCIVHESRLYRLSFSTACARLNIRTNSWHAREQKISLPGLQTGLLRFYLSSFHLSMHEKNRSIEHS